MSEPDSAPAPSPETSAKGVVGIGASAGGLESLERFFQSLPLRTGLAFVVVQHLAPDHESLMGELLGRFTALPVKQAEQNDPLQSDHVYVLPPGKEMEIEGQCLRLFERGEYGKLSLPIDRFFTSLAIHYGPLGFGVILSGSGTDGSRGVRRLHDVGGFVAVEDPKSARFDGMPRAAVQTQVVDAVAPAAELPAILMGYARDNAAHRDPDKVERLAEIAALLEEPLGVDFTQYKDATILRRVTRRLRLLGMSELSEYLPRLRADEEELLALGHDLLIGVTSFFRDPATWEAVQRVLIPLLLEAPHRERGLRCWVAGCSTGEEAYTLAILLLEAAPKDVPVRVFATDVHREALATASTGVYPQQSVGQLSDERMARFFRRHSEGKVQVSDELRNTVVFATHNVLRDAPFTQLDLVSCRNLLIYFRPKTQTQALTTLQFGLRRGGAMLLGSSETLGDVAADYAPIDEVHRVYLRTHVSRRTSELSLQRLLVRPAADASERSPSNMLAVYGAVLDRVMPPSFLVRPDRTVLECFGGAERYLRVPASGVAMMNLVDLAPEPARAALSGMITHATSRGDAVSTGHVRWPNADGETLVTLEVQPISSVGLGATLLVTLRPSVDDSPAPAPKAISLEELRTAHLSDLEDELSLTKGHLQSAVEDLEASGEEMQSTNEELFASNEELQSTNEELHSVNEELHTVNAELQSKVRELWELNRDMQQLFENIDVAFVFLDSELNIRRITKAAGGLLGLLPHDVGRPLRNLNLPLEHATLMSDLESCLKTRMRKTFETRDQSGRTCLVQMSATEDDGERSVVLSVSDVTSLQAARKRVRLLSAAADSSADAIIVLNLERRVIEWNSAAEKLYGIRREDILGHGLDAIIPEGLSAEFESALSEVSAGASQVNLVTRRLHSSGTPLRVGTTVSPVLDESDNLIGFSKFDRDVSEQQRREEALREREQRLADAFNNSPDMLASVDMRTGRLVDFNDTLARSLGYSDTELQEFHFSQLYTPESRSDAHSAAERLRRTGELRNAELVMRRSDGSTLPVALNSTAVRDEEGEVVRSRTVIRDITMSKQAENAMTEAVRMREYFLATASHELRTPMHAIRSASQLLNDAGTTDSERAQAVKVLTRQSAHVSELLDALLDVARMTQNRLDLSPKVVDLCDPASEAIEAFKYAYAEQGIRLEANGLGAPLPVNVDGARIQQALSNLLGNALRHSPAGSCVHVSVRREGERAIIEVTDEGDGIAKERLDSIFEAFASGGHDRIHRGALGLGLSLARRIIAGHGGTLIATSPGVDQGSSFRIELPLEKQAATTTHQPKKSVREGSRIVLIEDQQDSREMLAMLLKRRGDVVYKAENGEQGVALILKERPDLALVDIGLPDMDGYHVAALVREQGGQDIPLVALTGYGQREDVLKSQEAGFRLHLTKPISMQALDQAICDIVLPPETDRG